MVTGFGKFLLVVSAGFIIFGNRQDLADFQAGPVITEFGKIAKVKPDMEIPRGTKFKVRFDIGQQAASGKINSAFETAARFVNMHVEAGVPREDIRLALVVHGGASLDVTNEAFYRSRHDDRSNNSASAVKTLLQNDVEIYICGQSATYHKIGRSELLPGVKIALSAMTAHALLDQQGYSLNPF